MPEVGQITYGLKELTALMLRDQGIRSGLWMVQATFGQSVTNITSPASDPIGFGGPGVVSVLLQIGIQRAKEPGPLTVDASQIWNKRKPQRAKKGRAGSRVG